MKFFAVALIAVALAAAQANVVDLEDAQFAKTVGDSDIAFVKFFAPWCGHCKRLAPAWKDVADNLKDDEKIVIAEVDCTKQRELCAAHQIRGYPTLKTFKGGDTKGEKYVGARDARSLETHVRDQVDMLRSEL